MCGADEIVVLVAEGTEFVMIAHDGVTLYCARDNLSRLPPDKLQCLAGVPIILPRIIAPSFPQIHGIAP